MRGFSGGLLLASTLGMEETETVAALVEVWTVLVPLAALGALLVLSYGYSPSGLDFTADPPPVPYVLARVRRASADTVRIPRVRVNVSHPTMPRFPWARVPLSPQGRVYL